jgi:hypothetical protein
VQDADPEYDRRTTLPVGLSLIAVERAGRREP